MIRHIAGRDDCYVITGSHERDATAPWRRRLHGYASLHAPRVKLRAEWALLPKRGHGVGVELGRNGNESDLGLSLYAGRVGSLWLRARTPWTKWANVRRPADGAPRNDAMPWHEPRHTGVHIAPFRGCILRVQIDNPSQSSSRSRPWWHEVTLMTRHLTGRTNVDSDVVESGTTGVPMPEGLYPATYTRTVFVRRYTRPLGTWRDRILGPRMHTRWEVEVAGGVPHEGKGENSWDCGMDGTYSLSTSSARTLEDALGQFVADVLRSRARHGGPHDLPRPMTVAEAERHERCS